MTDSLPDDARLRATEAQMRRALGLQSDGPSQSTPTVSSPTSTMGLHPQRRRFVRDGEVTVQHKEHSAAAETGTNQLAVARQALREQTAAREEAERALTEVQATIRDLQTKLAHERLARDEAVNRAELARQTAEQALQSAREDLESERAFRLQAEEKLATATERHRETPRQAELLGPPPAPRRRGRPPKIRLAEPMAEPMTEPMAEPAEQDAQSDFVEWWVPGWQDRFR